MTEQSEYSVRYHYSFLSINYFLRDVLSSSFTSLVVDGKETKSQDKVRQLSQIPYVKKIIYFPITDIDKSEG